MALQWGDFFFFFFKAVMIKYREKRKKDLIKPETASVFCFLLLLMPISVLAGGMVKIFCLFSVEGAVLV